MEIDALSAVFVVVIAVVTMLAAVYGSEYLRMFAGRKNLGVSWFFFNLLAASMLLVVVARNGVLFLTSWELMSLASFFLVTLEDEKENVRRAGWTYLVAMHLGTAFLLALFLLLGENSGSLDFERLSTNGGAQRSPLPAGGGRLRRQGRFHADARLAAGGPPRRALARVGRDERRDDQDGHLWTAADAHAARAAGLVVGLDVCGRGRSFGRPRRTLRPVAARPETLVGLPQCGKHRHHRAGARGWPVLGISYGNPAMAALGLTGGLLHVVNHALFKSLLFLGAGSVLHATGTGDLDRQGGLLRRMPVTGATFLIGAAAISGLPPLNGFVSEFLIYLGAIAGLGSQARIAPAWPLMSVLVVGGLALIGGLAAACFSQGLWHRVPWRAAERRGGPAPTRPAAAMRWPMVVLAGLCVLDRAGSAVVAPGAPAGGGHRSAGEHERGVDGKCLARPSRR